MFEVGNAERDNKTVENEGNRRDQAAQGLAAMKAITAAQPSSSGLSKAVTVSELPEEAAETTVMSNLKMVDQHWR